MSDSIKHSEYYYDTDRNKPLPTANTSLSPADIRKQTNTPWPVSAKCGTAYSDGTIAKEKDEPGKAKTYDDGKLPLAWLPWAAIDELSKVQQYGASKYDSFNNYRRGMEVTRNLSCALRHIRDYLTGHDTDSESGCHPLSHAMCRLAFVLQNIHDGTQVDDRYKTPKQFNPDLEVVIKDLLRQKP